MHLCQVRTIRQHIGIVPCFPLGVGGDLSVLPGVATVVEVVGVPLPPTVIGVNVTGLSVRKGLRG